MIWIYFLLSAIRRRHPPQAIPMLLPLYPKWGKFLIHSSAEPSFTGRYEEFHRKTGKAPYLKILKQGRHPIKQNNAFRTIPSSLYRMSQKKKRNARLLLLWYSKIYHVLISSDKTLSSAKNDTKIIWFGSVVLILQPFRETQSFTNFVKSAWATYGGYSGP